jgi:hypothetical protein
VKSIWIRIGKTRKKTPQQLTQISSKSHMNWCINGSVVGIVVFRARGTFWNRKMFNKMFQVRLMFHLNQFINFLNRKPDSVVYIATTLRAGGYGNRIPVGTIFSALVQPGPGAHPISHTMETGSFSRR